MISSYIFSLFFSFLSGFIINYCVFTITLKGYLGKFLQTKLSNKVQMNDFVWLNKIIIFIFLVVIIVDLFSIPVYLDNDNTVNINVSIGDTKFSVSGDYMNLLFEKYGAIAAFTVGAKIVASFVAKTNLPLSTKMGVTAGGAVGSSFIYSGLTHTSEMIRGRLLAKTSNNTITLELKDTNITSTIPGVNSKTPLNSLNIDSSSREMFYNRITPKINLSSNETPLNILENSTYKHLISTTNPNKGNSTVEAIENFTSQSLGDIFAKGENQNPFEIILNSPLEPVESELIQIKADLISVLSNELALHGIMVYLICVLIFIFTIKIVIDKNISIERVKMLPLGKFIHFILSKLISSWRFTATTWIYIILSILLVFSCSSSYIIYNCIVILKLL